MRAEPGCLVRLGCGYWRKGWTAMGAERSLTDSRTRKATARVALLGVGGAGVI